MNFQGSPQQREWRERLLYQHRLSQTLLSVCGTRLKCTCKEMENHNQIIFTAQLFSTSVLNMDSIVCKSLITRKGLRTVMIRKRYVLYDMELLKIKYQGYWYTAISKNVALVIHDAWSMFHSPQCIMGASLVQNIPVKYKFTMRGPRQRGRRCLSSLLFIPCLKFSLTILIYVSAPRGMKHGPCITHHGSQEQPFWNSCILRYFTGLVLMLQLIGSAVVFLGSEGDVIKLILKI